MDYSLDLQLWDAVRDGDLTRAAAALEGGADVNLRLGLTADPSTGGRRTWDLFDGAGLCWRHVLVTAYPGSPTRQPAHSGVPSTRKAVPARGDTLLILAAKLKWPALVALLAGRVELDETLANAEGETAAAVAQRLGNGRKELYVEHLVRGGGLLWDDDNGGGGGNAEAQASAHSDFRAPALEGEQGSELALVIHAEDRVVAAEDRLSVAGGRAGGALVGVGGGGGGSDGGGGVGGGAVRRAEADEPDALAEAVLAATPRLTPREVPAAASVGCRDDPGDDGGDSSGCHGGDGGDGDPFGDPSGGSGDDVGGDALSLALGVAVRAEEGDAALAATRARALAACLAVPGVHGGAFLAGGTLALVPVSHEPFLTLGAAGPDVPGGLALAHEPLSPAAKAAARKDPTLHGTGLLLSPERVGRLEFRRRAVRRAEDEARRLTKLARDGASGVPRPIVLGGHVEQPSTQKDPAPRGNDETYTPVFARCCIGPRARENFISLLQRMSA